MLVAYLSVLWLGQQRALAAIDLMQMRPTGETSQGDKIPPAITQAALAAQRPAFAGREALFSYLQAAHAYYVEHDAAGALRLLPTGTPRQPMTALAFTRVLHEWIRWIPGDTVPGLEW